MDTVKTFNVKKFFNLRTLARMDYAIADLVIDLLELESKVESEPINNLQEALIYKKKIDIHIQQIYRANFIRDNKVNV